MHYFIYPTKDAWISSGSNRATTGVSERDQNYGQDQILELKKVYSNNSFDYQTRALVQFDLNESGNSISQSIVNGDITNPKFYLRMYEAEGTQELSTEYKLSAHAVSQSWDEGTGKFGDVPKVTNGVSWENRQNIPGATEVTWSNANGTKAHGVATHSVSSSVQSFSYQSPDIEMDITDMAKAWLSGSQPGGFDNHGLLLRFSGSQEHTASADGTYTTGNLKFFSTNTHTIYPPKLEVRWDSHTASLGNNTGSLTQLTMSGVDNYLYVKGLRDYYKETEKVRFRIGARKRYIDKTFSTSLATHTGSYVPEGSGSYSIIDQATGEKIVPFSSYTSMSCSPTDGMYFDQWLNTFQPNRVYKILLKLTDNDNNEYIYDEDYEFKVVK